MKPLSDHIDWHYVLREFWSVYRFSSAGGSRPIRSHQRQVRDLISSEMAVDPDDDSMIVVFGPIRPLHNP